MAMLAEPKRKQKLSFDPRNKAWSNDTNKVGQQLMEKMGWKQGKGLGINEDGKTSHIGVSLKNNTLGLGCSQEHEDNWISHQDDFNDLLTSLNQDHKIHNDKSVSSKPQSLQEKSKKAKKRVHYKKFTAGKDLSMYGDNAMNCIMGVRSKSNTPHSQSETNSDNDANSDGESTGRAGLGFTSSSQHHNTSLQDNFGVQTITSTNSMQDYFAQKMKELREKRKVDAASNVKTESEDTVFDSITIQQDSDSEENTHKKKKRNPKEKKTLK